MSKSVLTLAASIGLSVLCCLSSDWRLTAADAPSASDWHIAGPFGGSAKSLGLDPKNPKIVLAGAMNSLLYRSDDGGQSWQLLDFPKRNLSEVTCVLVDPSDSHHYMAGIISADGGGLFDSVDEGKTWTTVKGVENFGVRSLVAAPSKPTRFISGTLRGVMMSEDSGKTWTRISDPQNAEMQGITAVAVDPQNPDLIYAGTSHLPWKTTDGGKTWESIHSGMIDDSDVFSLYVDKNNPQDVFASACSGIYASTNRGDMWKKLMGIPNTSRRTHVIREDPSNPNILFAGTTTGLFKSANSGTSWRTLNNAQVNSMVFDPTEAGEIYMAMEYEGIGKTNNDGENITLTNKGFVDRNISSVTLAGDKLIAVEPSLGESSGVFVSTDKGDTWKQMNDVKGLLGVHLKAIAGMPNDPRILVAAAPRQLYRSIDGGLEWKPVPMKVIIKEAPAPVKTSASKLSKTHTASRARVAPKPVEKLETILPSEFFGLYTVRSGTKDLIFAANDRGLFISKDLGERWTQAPLPGALGVTGLFVAPNSDGRLFARSLNGLYFSNDYGENWAKYNFPLATSDINDVAIPVSHEAPLLVATRVGLYTTTDNGASWYANTKMPASTVSSVLYAGGTNMAYAVEYGRLYQSSDAGANWNVVPSALPTTRIRQLWMPDYTTNRLYGITTDLGILFRN
jgi:photosystem II stability/assembly factor-like uncharacterized protein